MESYPKDFDSAINAKEFKKDLGDMLASNGVSAQDTDISQFITEVRNARDPRLKGGCVIMIHPTNDGDRLVAYYNGRTVGNYEVYRYKSGYSPYSGAPQYKYKYASELTWTDAIDRAKKIWILDLTALNDGSVDEKRKNRRDARDGSVERKPNRAGSWGYDKSGYYVDTSKYKTILRDMKSTKRAKEILDQVIVDAEAANDLVRKAIADGKSLNKFASIFDNYQSVLDRLFEKAKELSDNPKKVWRGVDEDLRWELENVEKYKNALIKAVDEAPVRAPRESLKESDTPVDKDELIAKLTDALNETVASLGYDTDENLVNLTASSFKGENSDGSPAYGTKITISGEFGYSTFDKIADKLDKVFEEEGIDSYFEGEVPGRWVAVIWDDDVKTECTESNDLDAKVEALIKESESVIDGSSKMSESWRTNK